MPITNKSWRPRFKRCQARHDKTTGDIYWGRCELGRDHEGQHYLERGLMSVYWY